MNISTNVFESTSHATMKPTLAEWLQTNREAVDRAGYMVTGQAVLVPETDEDAYPGSYRVWWPITDGEGRDTWYVYIDPEGKAIEVECPVACGG